MKEEDVPITIDVVKLGTSWELEKLRFEGFIDELNYIQQSFNYQLAGDIPVCQFDPYTIYGKDELISAIKLKFKSARNLKSRPYIIGVTVAPIEGNLFGFSRYKENIGIITTNQWEHFSPPDADVYLMYEIANRTLGLLVRMPPHMDWDRGCLFDYCSWKENIKLGMKSGSLCNDCVERLAEYERENKITRKQIESIKDILNVVAEKTRQTLKSLSESREIFRKESPYKMEYSFEELQQLLRKALKANKQEKGPLFEKFVARFFSMVPSFYVIEDVHSDTEQFDIVIDMNPEESGGLWWAQFLPLIYIECKNRIETTSQNIISAIGGKATTHGAKLVFIVTSADVSPQAFQQSCYFTLSGCCIVIVKLEEIQKIISTKSNVNEFLRKKVRNAYMRVPP